jgi:hypothetical protein
MTPTAAGPSTEIDVGPVCSTRLKPNNNSTMGRGDQQATDEVWASGTGQVVSACFGQNERLPPYAHDLNPIEMVWGNVKAVELANLCPDTIDQARTAAAAGLHRIGARHDLCYAFLTTPGFLCDHHSPYYRNVLNVGSYAQSLSL